MKPPRVTAETVSEIINVTLIVVVLFAGVVVCFAAGFVSGIAITTLTTVMAPLLTFRELLDVIWSN